MSPADETELHRLSDMLQVIEDQLGVDSPQTEALRKAGIALVFGFIHGSRSKIEEEYGALQRLRTDRR